MASLRRAQSSAYYALFHCLARECADLLIGGSKSNRSDLAWRQVYRSLDHGHARQQCAQHATMKKFPKNIEDFANLFVSLQKKRHAADYDPFEKFVKSAVENDVKAAESAMKAFKAVKVSDRRAFCAWVLLKNRPN